MIQVHYHWLIRGIAKGVNTISNTINCISKSSIIVEIQNKLELNFRKKTWFSVDDINFDNNKEDCLVVKSDFSPDLIIDQLEKNIYKWRI